MRSQSYGTWSVCVSVYLSMAILALQSMGRPMCDTSGSEQRDLEKEKGKFPKTTAFRRYGVKTCEKKQHMLLTMFIQLDGRTY